MSEVTISTTLLTQLQDAHLALIGQISEVTNLAVKVENHMAHIRQLMAHQASASNQQAAATATQQAATETPPPTQQTQQAAPAGDVMPWDQPAGEAADQPATQEPAFDPVAFRKALQQRFADYSHKYGDPAMLAIKNIIQSRTGQPSIKAVPDDKLQTLDNDLTTWEQHFLRQQQGAA